MSSYGRRNSRSCLLLRYFAGHGNERYGRNLPLANSFRSLRHQDEPLRPAAHGNHQTASGSELFDERWGNVVRATPGDDDRVEWGVFGPTAVPVAATGGHIVISQFLQQLAGAFGKRRDDFDAVNRLA